eukprot:145369-Rhodomonas_salina.1
MSAPVLTESHQLVLDSKEQKDLRMLELLSSPDTSMLIGSLARLREVRLQVETSLVEGLKLYDAERNPVSRISFKSMRTRSLRSVSVRQGATRDGCDRIVASNSTCLLYTSPSPRDRG